MKGSVLKENTDYGAGYLIGYSNNISQCPFCNETLTDIPISDDDFLCIRKISNYDRNFLQAMIELKQKDPIEYQLKMSQFRTQAQQQESIQKQQSEQSKVHCPYCNSTNVKKIIGTERVASVAMLGIFSKKINKSFKCGSCGGTF